MHTDIGKVEVTFIYLPFMANKTRLKPKGTTGKFFVRAETKYAIAGQVNVPHCIRVENHESREGIWFDFYLVLKVSQEFILCSNDYTQEPNVNITAISFFYGLAVVKTSKAAGMR